MSDAPNFRPAECCEWCDYGSFCGDDPEYWTCMKHGHSIMYTDVCSDYANCDDVEAQQGGKD